MLLKFVAVLFFLLISISLIKSNPHVSINIDIDDLKDFTFDNANSCQDVNIQMPAVPEFTGFIHSPNYKSRNNKIQDINEASCRWTLSAPVDYRIELTFFDFENDCNAETNESLIIESRNELFMKLESEHGQSEKSSVYKFPGNQFKSCDFDMKLFSKLETISNYLVISYDDSKLTEFLVYFKIIHDLTENNTCADVNCEIKYDLNGMHTHKSCLPESLLCGCAQDCKSLIDHYGDYLNQSEFLAQNGICSFYSALNNLCQTVNYLLFQPKLKFDERESDVYYNQLENSGSVPLARKFVRPEELAQMECGSLMFTSEYGWISSPNFLKSRSYASNLDCFYSIKLQPNQIIQLRFNQFNLRTNITNFTLPEIVAYSSRENTSEPMAKRDSILIKKVPNLKEDAIKLTSTVLRNFFKNSNSKAFKLNHESDIKKIPSNLGITYDYDYLNIYDGPTEDSTLLAHLTAEYNDFNQNFKGRVFNSKSNSLFLKFHSAKLDDDMIKTHQGFNLTYQIKGFCIEDQKSCNSIYELNCYSPSQVCNDVWDCHNGADERGCGPCKHDQFRCKNHIFCYRHEDRCDGDHQCLDFSDELNCNSWFCNSNNGTFLCDNEQCVYEQWVCDGTNDCKDGSDERNCPTPFTRRVITTAVLGGTLCCLLLVMALGCACKLYTLHTVGFRNNIRLSQTVQSAAAAAAAAPLLATTNSQVPNVATLPSSRSNGIVNESSSANASSEINNTDSTTGRASGNSNSFFNNNFGNIFSRSFMNNISGSRANNNNNSVSSSNSGSQIPSGSNSSNIANILNENSNIANNGYQFNFNNTSNSANSDSNAPLQPGELPLPHHSIAPPTYNQTMGLVDEYEQRQLAFIEHVRSILAQQQNQNGAASSGLNLINLNGSGQNSLSALTLIPTVTSSSTTVHRVTNSGRRSHSGRHHRHHHHHRSSSSYADQNAQGSNGNSNQDQGNNIIIGGAASNSSSSNRSHRHRHHNRHSNHSNSRSHNIYHHITNNLTQVNFDANRRGLLTQQSEDTPATTSSATTSHSNAVLLEAQNQLMPNNPSASTLSSNQTAGTVATTSNNLTSTLTNMSNKTTSVNLRDKIAKLIKDIVVHHGDNIQYVQLADQLNGSGNNRSNMNSTPASSSRPGNSIELTSSESTTSDNNDLNNNSSPSQETFIDNNLGASSTSTGTILNHNNNNSSSNNNNNSNGNEDDVPLIQP